MRFHFYSQGDANAFTATVPLSMVHELVIVIKVSMSVDKLVKVCIMHAL